MAFIQKLKMHPQNSWAFTFVGYKHALSGCLSLPSFDTRPSQILAQLFSDFRQGQTCERSPLFVHSMHHDTWKPPWAWEPFADRCHVLQAEDDDAAGVA